MFATVRAGLRREVLADIADTIDMVMRDPVTGPFAYLERRGRQMVVKVGLPLNGPADFTVECNLASLLAFEAGFDDDDVIAGHAAFLRREAAKMDRELKRRQAAREEHAARKVADV
jgi:hypothetical protein